MPIKELIEECKTRASLYGLAQAVEAELAEREELIGELKDSERIWSKQHAEVSKRFIAACEEVDSLRAQLAAAQKDTELANAAEAFMVNRDDLGDPFDSPQWYAVVRAVDARALVRARANAAMSEEPGDAD